VAYVSDTSAALKQVDREGARFQQVEGVVAQVRRSPLGVVLCMGPFNCPEAQSLRQSHPMRRKPPWARSAHSRTDAVDSCDLFMASGGV
jgi:hypothetical protein